MICKIKKHTRKKMKNGIITGARKVLKEMRETMKAEIR